MPGFVQALGFDPKFSFFTSGDIKTMGLLLQQSDQPGNPRAQITKSYQHPSWKNGGWLGPVLVDQQGNIFTAPAPFISVLNNPSGNQNTVYQVNANSAVMDIFIKLPIADSTVTDNPFGIIDMVLLCETNTLYVSTLSGSDRTHERGAIYAIDIAAKKIIDKLTATDAMGMGITYITGQRRLFFGSGRNSDIFSIIINEKGKFSSKPKEEFSLQGLGPNGDDKVRRINVDANGNLLVHGIGFDYNLKPQREKIETVFRFLWNADHKNWTYSSSK